jgi:hypothetical protein
MRASQFLCVLISLTAACAFDGDDNDDDGPLGGSLVVTGEVVDFQTGMAINTAASVTTSGLLPAPEVTTRGAEFTIAGIPENSAFQILASAPPAHRQTFSPAVVVTDADKNGIKAPAVSEALLGQLATAFGVTPTAAKGVLFVRLVDAAGAPKTGVTAADIVLAGGGAVGPKFLDANLAPATGATATTASGWAVFFEVPPGAVSLASSTSATVTVDMATSPVQAGAITLAEGVVTSGAPTLPTNVSFATTLFPMFAGRGCVACHSGNGPGKELGGLKLDGSANAAYKELVLEKPNTRVRTGDPESSLVLRYPSREDPPDRHPNITFASSRDPDYVRLLVWIREGAKDN